MLTINVGSYFLAAIGTFVSVFLKGLQHKNVIHDMYKWIAVTSYLMALVDVFLVKLIVSTDSGDWVIGIATGTGAAAGMIASMKMHRRYLVAR